MAYPRDCIYCGQLIIMSEVSQGRWQPWEPDDSRRHQCGSGHITSSLRTSDPETRLSPCPWCKYPVYYHTNGYGDSVYFDELGIPWKIHPCWKQYWETQTTGQKEIERQRQFLFQEERKHRKLIYAIEEVVTQKLSFQTNVSFEMFEIKVANTLHLNLRQFRQEYGGVYSLELSAIRLRGFQLPSQQRTKKTKKTEKAKTLPASTKIKKKKKSSGGGKMVNCSYCRTATREGLLEQHLLNAHKIDVSIISVLPEIPPLPDEVGCPYCRHVQTKSSLTKHIQRWHEKQFRMDKSLGKIPKPLPVCPCCVRAVHDFKGYLKEKHPDRT